MHVAVVFVVVVVVIVIVMIVIVLVGGAVGVFVFVLVIGLRIHGDEYLRGSPKNPSGAAGAPPASRPLSASRRAGRARRPGSYQRAPSPTAIYRIGPRPQSKPMIAQRIFFPPSRSSRPIRLRIIRISAIG